MNAGDAVAIALPSGLRERVLEASRQARAAGHSYPDVAEIEATEAMRRAADAFYAVLCALSDDDWQVPVLRDLTVQGLVGHLIGVEVDVQRCLRGDPAVSETDHVASTQPTALRQARRRPVQTRTTWRREANRTLALVDSEGDLDAQVAIHGLDLSLGVLLVVRAFELWTHENDIRTAAGLPASVPDPSTLRLMTALAARGLPVGADRVGLRDATRVRLVLTGTGGGTWDVAIGEGDSEDAIAVRLVADAVDFCRLAANRLSPAEVDIDVTGDAERAAAVLTAFAALALD